VSSVPELPEAGWERDGAPALESPCAPFASSECADPDGSDLAAPVCADSSWLAVGGAVSFHLPPPSLLHTTGIDSLKLPSAPLSALLMADAEA
jgi:hypothetical protein